MLRAGVRAFPRLSNENLKCAACGNSFPGASTGKKADVHGEDGPDSAGVRGGGIVGRCIALSSVQTRTIRIRRSKLDVATAVFHIAVETFDCDVDHTGLREEIIRLDWLVELKHEGGDFHRLHRK